MVPLFLVLLLALMVFAWQSEATVFCAG
jgi:hypothetical protein